MKRSRKEREILRRNIYRFSMMMTCLLIGKEMKPYFSDNYVDIPHGDIVLSYEVYSYNESLYRFYTPLTRVKRCVVISCIREQNPMLIKGFFKDCYMMYLYVYQNILTTFNQKYEFKEIWDILCEKYYKSLERINE